MSDSLYHALCLFFGVGYLMACLLQISPYALTIRSHRDAKTWMAAGMLAMCLLMLAADVWWMFGAEWSTPLCIGHGAAYTLLVVGFFVIPTARQQDHRTMRFMSETVITAVLLAGAVGVAVLAVAFLGYGVQSLFGINIDKVTEDIMYLMITIVYGTMFFFLLPNPAREGNATAFTQKICSTFGKYLLLPVMLLYMLVLYAYIAKIVVSWELPNGCVTWMTCAMMGGLLGVVFLLYPQLYGENESHHPRLTHFLRYALHLMALPPLVLMSIGLYRRIGDYDWTINRVYALALNIWFYAACLLMLIRCKKQRKLLTRLLMSFAVVWVCLSVIPHYNVAQCTQRRMAAQLDDLVNHAAVAFPDTAISADEMETWFQQISHVDYIAISSKMSYLNKTFGEESISRYWNGEGKLRLYNAVYGTEKNNVVFVYNADRNNYDFVELPDGYTQMKPIDYNARYAEKIEDDIYRLTLLCSPGDTARVMLNARVVELQSRALWLPADDGDLLMFTYIELVKTDDSANMSLYSSGYWFKR